jgi:uncharacterized protein with HEPN domain
MFSRGDLQLIKDIVKSIYRINDYILGIEYRDFIDDSKTQDAVIRNLEIIGEAVNKLYG